MGLQKRWKKLKDHRYSNKMMGAIKESPLEGDSSASEDEVRVTPPCQYQLALPCVLGRILSPTVALPLPVLSS